MGDSSDNYPGIERVGEDRPQVAHQFWDRDEGLYQAWINSSLLR